MSKNRKHRHSDRKFPQMVQIPAPTTCGACRYHPGCHPGRACLSPQLIDVQAALAALELRVKYATLGITCTTVETQPCDPALVREVIRAYSPDRTHATTCGCVECGGMPTWAYDWLNRDIPA